MGITGGSWNRDSNCKTQNRESCKVAGYFRIDISVNTLVIQSEAKNLGNTMAGVNVDVHEILPPFGRLNDK